MKKDRIPEIPCSEVEILTAKKLAEELSEDERRSLSHHLLNCENCRNALSAAEALLGSLHHSREKSLLPALSIQRRLRKRVKRLTGKRVSPWETSFEVITGILKLQVPVYQPVLGMAVFLMLMLYANYLSFPGNRSTAGAPGNYQLADSTEILDSLKIQNSDAVGRNIKEDSLLARFFKTVM